MDSDIAPLTRLAAAVVQKAIKHARGNIGASEITSKVSRELLIADAQMFLQSDMGPFAEVLGFDPSDHTGTSKICEELGLTVCKYHWGAPTSQTLRERRDIANARQRKLRPRG